MLKKLSLMAASAVSVFAMHNAEININNKDLELSVNLDMGQFNDTTEPDTIFVGFKYLNADEANSNTTKIDDFVEVNFLMIKEVTSDLKIGLGIKLNHTRNFTSIPLGVNASYKLPFNSAIPLYVGGYIYYAPEVLSMEKAQDFIEYRANFDAEVIENGRITIGYRTIHTNYKAGDVKYNQAAYIGFKFAF